MPRKGNRLTPQERVFAAHMARTNDATYAAEKAGYAHPLHAGSNVMRREGVRGEVLRRQRERIETEGVTVAVDFAILAVGEERFPPGVRLNAAKLLMEHAFRDSSAAQEREGHEMTPEELRRAIANAKAKQIAAEHQLAELAKPILEHEPDPKPGIFD